MRFNRYIEGTLTKFGRKNCDVIFYLCIIYLLKQYIILLVADAVAVKPLPIPCLPPVWWW